MISVKNETVERVDRVFKVRSTYRVSGEHDYRGKASRSEKAMLVVIEGTVLKGFDAYYRGHNRVTGTTLSSNR